MEPPVRPDTATATAIVPVGTNRQTADERGE